MLEKLSANRSLKQQGVNIAPERHTVGTWLVRWLDDQKPPAVKPKTYSAYEYQTRFHLIPGLGSKLLAKLERSDVQRLLNSKLADGLSPKTVRTLQ